jgi:adenosine deaminase
MVADLHLHFEGTVPRGELVSIARENDHAFGAPGAFEKALAQSREAGSFLRLFADCCRLLSGPPDYARAAAALGRELARDLVHAEIFVSPEIWKRFGLDAVQTLRAVDRGLAEAEADSASRFYLLLDSVRQWGAEAAERVLDLYEEVPLPRIVGFGLGGEEKSVKARAFRKVYDRARALGLSTSVHAGEWAGPSSVEEAIDQLGPDRIDHGVRAAEEKRLLSQLARMKLPLSVAPSSNIATGVAPDWRAHPLPRLLDAGVAVCLSADDPTLFETSTRKEYERATREFRLSSKEIEAMQATAWNARFGGKA